MTCKHLCHNPCHLDSVYSQGHIQLKNCAAMNGDNCKECSHSYEVHSHSTSLRIERTKEYEDEEMTLEYEEVVNYDAKREFELAQADMRKIETEIANHTKMLTNSQGQLESCMKKIAHMHRELKETCNYASDDFLLNYIQHMSNQIEKNPSLGYSEKESKKKELEVLGDQYKALKYACQAAKSYDQNLTPEELSSIVAMKHKLEAEQSEMIASYRQNRLAHKISDKQT